MRNGGKSDGAESYAAVERFQTILDHAHTAVFMKDLLGRYLVANGEAEQILGVGREQLIGRTDDEVVGPDVAAALRAADVATLASSEPIQVEEKVPGPDGRIRTYLSVKFALRDDDGQPYATAGIATDITERKQIEAALRRSEQQFSLAFDGAPYGMSLAELLPDGTARLVRVNQAACALAGYDAAELKVLGPWALVPPEDQARVAAALGELTSRPGDSVRVEHGMLSRDGTLRWVSHSLAVVPDADSVGQLLISHFEDMTDRRSAEIRLAHMAFHDPLTGLANRAMLRDRLEQGLLRQPRHEGVVAVLFSDLDRFKIVNDSLGHDVGDGLLVEVAARLLTAVRLGDTVARFGGDEFVVLAEGVPDERAAAELAGRLHQALEAPFHVGGRDLVLEASIGVAIGNSPDQRPEDLLRDADTAMYRAKSRGHGLTEFFGQQDRARLNRGFEIEAWLRDALVGSSLELNYQPQVSLADGRVTGAEALLRWRGTPLPQLQVSEVIAAAEESGLILPLGAWVLEQACSQLARWDRWRRADGTPLIATVSINLSPSQVVRNDLVTVVSDALDRSAIDPRRLCVEITETAILSDVDAAIAGLRDLRQLGVRTALDDFGTGYSSLSYLTRLPIDVIKIDRTFVAALGTGSPHAAVVDAVVAMARRLGVVTVGEGAESAAQVSGLITSGTNEVQGFYFARPLGEHQILDRVPELEQRAIDFLRDAI